MANEDDTRAQIFEEMKAFLQEQKFDKAKKLYLDNALLLKDNGLYECLSAYLYGCLLSREEQYVEALKYLQRSINILDANYEDVINLHDINFVIPYYPDLSVLMIRNLYSEKQRKHLKMPES